MKIRAACSLAAVLVLSSACLSAAPLAVAARSAAAKKDNPALVPVQRHFPERHERIKALVKAEKPELVFIGDSITHQWGGVPEVKEKGVRPVGDRYWKHYYGHRKALNMGFSSDRVENVLWRLQNGEFDGISPKVAVIMIGTNNNPGPATAAQTAEGVEAICKLVNRKSPKTKILLLGVFPRAHRTPKENAFPGEVNAFLAKLDGKLNVTYLDLAPRLANPDGTLVPGAFYDKLHPGEAGYRIWAEAMEPVLAKLLGDKPVEPVKP